MAIYLDVVWVLNLLLDWMLLLLTQALTKEKAKKIRIFAAAVFASLLVPVTVIYPDSFFNSVTGKLLYSIAIILIAFHFYAIKRTLKLLSMFYFVTFATGGGMIAIHFISQQPVGINASGVLTLNHGFGDPVSWIFVLVGFPLVWFFTKRRMDKHAAAKIKYDQIYRVAITIKGKQFSTDGYIDSGNQLIDPLTKRCVVICDEQFLRNWFADDDWEALKQAFDDLNLESIPASWQEHIQLVPYRGVGGENGFLFAIRPEKLHIVYGSQEINVDKVLIGIQFGKLANDQMYHCLLHPQLVKLSATNIA